MKVYPNPTTDIVNVQLTMNNEQLNNVEIQVFDMFGKLLDIVETRCTTSLQHTEPIRTASSGASNMVNTQGSSAQTTQINLSQYAKGVYFVKAVSAGKTIAVRKLVKN